nr:Sua5 family C-terminal domain-containing protein [Exiguobacterium sp. SL14]
MTPPAILRPGGVTREQIETIIGPVTLDPALSMKDVTPKAPGMKYTHYAPGSNAYRRRGGSLILTTTHR